MSLVQLGMERGLRFVTKDMDYLNLLYMYEIRCS